MDKDKTPEADPFDIPAFLVRPQPLPPVEAQPTKAEGAAPAASKEDTMQTPATAPTNGAAKPAPKAVKAKPSIEARDFKPNAHVKAKPSTPKAVTPRKKLAGETDPRKPAKKAAKTPAKKAAKVARVRGPQVVTLRKSPKEDALAVQAMQILADLKSLGGKAPLDKLLATMAKSVETKQPIDKIWGFYRSKLIAAGYIAVAKAE